MCVFTHMYILVCLRLLLLPIVTVCVDELEKEGLTEDKEIDQAMLYNDVSKRHKKALVLYTPSPLPLLKV